jgi:signal transduction histidine kinase
LPEQRGKLPEQRGKLPETLVGLPITGIDGGLNEMKVQLISIDNDLYKICQEVLAELGCRECQLSGGIAEDPHSDLCIWDYFPELELELPGEANWIPVRHLFLVQRKDIGHFRQAAPYPDATIILKPVTRTALSAFLKQALSMDNQRTSPGESLREDRDELLQCLIEANLKLQEYDQDRTNFVARGIHDFRAPLTAVSGYCGLLLSGALGTLSAEQKEVIERMQQSSKRLWRMASAMLQLSVGRQHQIRSELRKCDLLDCLNQALNEITPVAAGKQIAITADLQPEGRFLYIEQSKIEHVFINLLDNACKFTPKFGEIEIHGYSYFWERRNIGASLAGGDRRSRQSRQPNSYRIDIRNSGAPIAPQHLQEVFLGYTSYSKGEDRSGGGLGLAICRMFASQHDGSIWAENTDRGPRFSVVLPARALAQLDISERDHERSPQLVEVV